MTDDEFEEIDPNTTDREATEALLSAHLDGALSRADREVLEARLSREPALAARLEQLRGVDDLLRGLASDALSNRDPLSGLDRLEARLGLESAAPPGAAPHERRRGWRGPVALGLAAAAAWILYLGLSRDSAAPPEEPASRSASAESTPAAGGVADPAQIEEGLVVGLGYAEDPDALLIAPELVVEDLEIIERLELLEYLAERDGEGHG